MISTPHRNRRRFGGSRLAAVGPLSVAALFLIAGCDSEGNVYAPQPPPEVIVANSVQRDVVEYVTYTGIVEASETVDLRARVEGFLERIDCQPGQRVSAGDVLGDPQRGGAIVEWIVERASAALACLAIGVCDEALRLTAEYAKTRKQFDQPIAMFQAVGHRAADAYIDNEGIRLTALQAAWRISEGLPAAKQIAVAKYWAADAGQRVVHAAQHLHGGIGVDKEYPLHRYFLYAKQLELTLGGSTSQLLRLGKLLADEAS